MSILGAIAKKIDYSFVGETLSFIFPTKSDRIEFRAFCRNIEIRKKYRITKDRYPLLINSFKQNKLKKFKVLFLVNEISKWKMQSVYDLMNESDIFEPVVALTIADFQKKFSKEKQISTLKNNYEYFDKKGMKCVYAYDFKKYKAKDLREFSPQIVFYQQPWGLNKEQLPYKVSEYALTCYVPYYVQNYGNFFMEADQELHRCVWRYYILNKEWEELFKEHSQEYTGEIKGLGHPMLDVFLKNKNYKAAKNYVIYAPHWSIEHEKNVNSENYSTFLKNGKEILEYAKSHPEINWVFKPHPTLKYTILKTGVMTEDEINRYYKEWENIAKSCYDADYPQLFLESKALITDCGSFLTEYFCTQKPIIHLISSTCKNYPMSPSKKYFNTFYKAHNLDEMYKYFDEILIKNNDYKKDERLKMLKECGFENNNASENIINDLITNLV